MHIVHIIEPVEMGGVFTWVVEMSNAQIKNGHKVTVIHSLREQVPDNWRAYFDSNVELIHVQMSRSIKPLLEITSLYKITKLINALDPDIIHSHSSKAGFLSRVAGFITGNNHKLFYTAHGIFFASADSKLSYYLYKYIEIIGYKLGGIVVSCSMEEGKIIKQHLTANTNNRLININNGVDENSVCKKIIRNDGKIRIGVHGRVTYKKGSQDFAKIAKNISAQYNNVEFIWIGGGEAESEQLLEDSGVSITGFVTRNEALQELAKLDIFFMTSLYEALSLSLLESQFTGIPAVVSDVPGNGQVIKSNENGFLAKDQADMEASLITLIENKELRKEMGTNALKMARANFSFEHMVRNYQNAYEQQIQNSQPKSVTCEH